MGDNRWRGTRRQRGRGCWTCPSRRWNGPSPPMRPPWPPRVCRPPSGPCSTVLLPSVNSPSPGNFLCLLHDEWHRERPPDCRVRTRAPKADRVGVCGTTCPANGTLLPANPYFSTAAACTCKWASAISWQGICKSYLSQTFSFHLVALSDLKAQHCSNVVYARQVARTLSEEFEQTCSHSGSWRRRTWTPRQQLQTGQAPVVGPGGSPWTRAWLLRRRSRPPCRRSAWPSPSATAVSGSWASMAVTYAPCLSFTLRTPG